MKHSFEEESQKIAERFVKINVLKEFVYFAAVLGQRQDAKNHSGKGLRNEAF